MTAALLVSLVLNIALLVALVGVAVLFSRTLADTIQLVDRTHIRSIKHQDALLDRIMAADWRSWREAHLEDFAEEGGQLFPTNSQEEDVGELIVTQLSDEDLRRMAHERTLLTEDFPDDENR